MKSLHRYVVVIGLACLLAAASAAAEPPLPEFYGVYGVANGKLYALDAPDKSLAALTRPIRVSRSESDFKSGGGPALPIPALPGSLNILVFAKGNPLATANQLSIQQIPFIRTLTLYPDDRNYRKRWTIGTWVATNEFGYAQVGQIPVTLRFKPVKDQSEMVVAVPSAPLDPGLYAIHYPTAKGKAEFLFAVDPLESAESSRCVDARVPGYQTSPCDQQPSPASAPDVSPEGGGQNPEAPTLITRTGLGYRLKVDDTPVYDKPDGDKIKDRLELGAYVANAKGWFLGIPRQYQPEEQNSRTHIAYINRDNRFIAGWVESATLDQFTYSCACERTVGDCTAISITFKATTWTECFQHSISEDKKAVTSAESP